MLIEPLVKEEWKPIDFFNIKKNMYKISNFGDVYSYAKGGLLSPAISNGYYTVQLVLESGERKTFYIHRLVAMAFVPNPDPLNLIEVNHINLTRHDNYYENLEWLTKQENIEHELANKNRVISIKQSSGSWSDGSSTYGENNGMAKLKESEVRIMLSELEKGASYTEAIIAAGFEPTENRRYNLSHIARGHRWKHVQKDYIIPEYIRW